MLNAKLRVYTRALGITTIRSIIFIAFLFVWTLFLLERFPTALNVVGIYTTFFVLSFFFAQWIFQGVKTGWGRFSLIVFITYVWDWLLALFFYSWLLKEDLFDQQRLLEHLIYFGMYVVAMSIGMFVKRRLSVQQSMAEGLES